ncbi:MULTISPECIES: HK97 gp10 family phage protein [unclassified Lysinibacillus]|uniref:HK97 gp10 family phage protein n=1 Tax=unclassified Lysinibacillus TaxID=2636778 RepID=UPI00380E7913
MAFEFEEVKQFAENLKELTIASGKTHKKVAERVAQIAIRKVKMLTPLDTGNLRDNWKYRIVKEGNNFIIIIYNQIENAPFVEKGHRNVITGRTVGYVNGQFLLELTEQEMKHLIPRMWEREIEKEWRRIMGG